MDFHELHVTPRHEFSACVVEWLEERLMSLSVTVRTPSESRQKTHVTGETVNERWLRLIGSVRVTHPSQAFHTNSSSRTSAIESREVAKKTSRISNIPVKRVSVPIKQSRYKMLINEDGLYP